MESELKYESRSGRSMRPKDRPSYLADIDDDIDGTWNFDLHEKLNDDKFVSKNLFYHDLKGSEVTVEFFQKNGFTKPILVREKSGLGLRIPSENFSVSDVKRCVGSRRVLDVMDVKTQKGLEMTLKEWVHYYEDVEQHKDRLLNVISLEFSHTRLEDYVEQPRVVHELDWVNCAWPWYYKELQSESTDAIDSMYPKVQKYCLMSVGDCYTDFHIDMGGTSVWYHILRGKKVFWFIPPTEENLALYIKWTLSTTQSDIFLGDIVKTCYRITLEAGWTFFIPTGWIHAVYTPVDSLVFGGNFLHSFCMPLQLGVSEIEAKTHVPVKFRYPLFKELHWYVLERYVSCLMGIEHRELSERELLLENGEVESVEELPIKIEHNEEKVEVEQKMDLSSAEYENNMSLEMTTSDAIPLIDEEEVVSACDVKMSCSNVFRVESKSGSIDKLSAEDRINGCSVSQKMASSVPFSRDRTVKLSDLKKKRCSRLAEFRAKMLPIRLTRYELEGLKAVSNWLENLPSNKRGVPKDIPEPDQLLKDCRILLDCHKLDDHEDAITGEIVLKWPPRKQPKRRKSKVSPTDSSKHVTATATPGTKRRRRVRCKLCEPCTRPDCRECVFCLDLKKYGGPQKMKQTCVSRRCLAPMLARDSTCEICGEGDAPHDSESRWWDDIGEEDWSSWLMECRVCCEVVHPACLRLKSLDTSHAGILDEDMPSSWDCSRCCERGKQGQCRPRYIKIFHERTSLYRSSNVKAHTEIEQIHSPIMKQKENKSRVSHSISSSQVKKDKSKLNHSSKFCGSEDRRQLKRDDSRSCERDDVKKKVIKIVKAKRPTSPDLPSEMNEPLAAVRVNSRGREITLPRRYMV